MKKNAQIIYVRIFMEFISVSCSENLRHVILTSVHGRNSLYEKVCLQVHCVISRALQLLFFVLCVQ